MTAEDRMEERRQAIKKSLEFFAGANKPQREKWLCRRFLEGLGLRITDDDLRVPEDESIDVDFRDARFQIKEMLDPDRRRTDEYRNLLQRAMEATSPKELLESVELVEMTPEQILAVVEDNVGGWARKYGPDFRSMTDLLVYFNLGVWFRSGTTPDSSHLHSAGFRSISLTTDSTSWVLVASQEAPEFLRTNYAVIHNDF